MTATVGAIGRRTFLFRAGAALSLIAVSKPTWGRAWPGAAGAAISLTYDDGLDSQLDHVAPFLESAGLRATFYLTVENIDERLADWIALSRRGHEIGNHSMTHPCRLKNYSSERLVKEQIDPSETYFDANFGASRLRTFAYPCGFERLGAGSGALRARRYHDIIQARFAAARSVGGQPNDPSTIAAQRYSLHAFEPTYDSDSPEAAYRYIDKAVAAGRWAILIFHDVLPARAGAGDTSERVHAEIVSYVRRSQAWCAPVGAVLSHLMPV